MDDNFDQSIEATTEDAMFEEEETHAKFECPKCGEITRDQVLFICNTCDSSELIHQDGMYMCPSCLQPGENFECVNCGSKDVVMKKASS